MVWTKNASLQKGEFNTIWWVFWFINVSLGHRYGEGIYLPIALRGNYSRNLLSAPPIRQFEYFSFSFRKAHFPNFQLSETQHSAFKLSAFMLSESGKLESTTLKVSLYIGGAIVWRFYILSGSSSRTSGLDKEGEWKVGKHNPKSVLNI